MNERKIVVPESIVGRGMDVLASKYAVHMEADLWAREAALTARLADAKALIVRNQTKVTAAVLAAAPQLRVVGRMGVGYDNINVAAASDRGVVVTFAPEENAVSVAELVMGMILALARKLTQADANVRAGGWDRLGCMGFELHGKTLGVLGLGKIGYRVALRARAFGMEIAAYDPYLSPSHFAVTETRAQLLPFEEVLEQADVLTVHLPLTDETRGILGADAFRRMKNTAVIVNAARGQVVDEAALIDALQSGRIAAAALDVREKEPPGESALHSMPNVLLTPHIGAMTVEGQEKVVDAVAADVDRVLQGQPARNYVNSPLPRP